MEFKPYIGITGFMDKEEIDVILDKCSQFLSPERQLMVGVLTSSKTMCGLTNKWPGRYPAVGKLKDIFPDSPLCSNIIHFNTDYPGRLHDDLCKMMEYGGHNCHGVQLNMKWPEKSQLASFRIKWPTKRIILQVGGDVLKEFKSEFGWNMNKLVKQIKTYLGVWPAITDVLLDPSGGFGKELDLRLAMDFLFEAKKLDIGIGIAGGLYAESVSRLKGIAREFPDVSLDAEGLLRTPLQSSATNHLDIDKANAYLRKASVLFH